MRRREFIVGLGGAAAWPLAAGAQHGERVRRIAVLSGLAEDHPETGNRLTALRESLRQLGWVEGRNLAIEYRYTGSRPALIAPLVAELVALSPEVIVANGSPAATALKKATRTIPVVITQILDPVGGGIVDSLARPGGNITGFTDYEFSMAGKWLELLKEIATGLRRVTMLGRTDSVAHTEMAKSAAEAAAMLELQFNLVNISVPNDIEEAMTAASREPRAGVVVIPTAPTSQHRKLVISLAANLGLPTIYPFGSFVRDGGLLAYGVDLADLYRRSATYVDRILKGESPHNLPFQAPTKFQLVINLKTAKALGIEVPPMLLARADEVIE